MKNVWNKLFILLILAIFSVSCTEEISEEIQNEEKLSSSNSSSLVAETKSMTLTNTVSDLYSHFLHEEDSETEGCTVEITDPDDHEASEYSITSTDFNTDCVLDAGEYDIYFQGASFQLDVDADLCENVEYRPFKFWKFQPGDSDRVIYQIECDSICASSDNTEVQALCGTSFQFDDWTGNAFSPISGDTFMDANFAGQNSIDTDDPDLNLCRFDYSVNDGPNCDQGAYKVYTYTLTGVEADAGATLLGSCSVETRTTQGDCETAGVWTDGTPGSCSVGGRTSQSDCEALGVWTDPNTCGDMTGATDPTWVISDSYEETECGGDHRECLGGDLDDLADPEDESIIYHTSSGEAFSQDFGMTSPFDDNLNSNMNIANYSRICSDPGVTKTETADSGTYPVTSLDTADIENDHDSNAYTASGSTAATDPNEVVIYAETARNGQSRHPDTNRISYSRYVTTPFYSFRCLDHAGDVKAQIRLFIREWDRSFTTALSSDFSFLEVSDITEDDSVEDLRYIDNDGSDATGNWNDVWDWDDFYDYYSIYTNKQCTQSDLAFPAESDYHCSNDTDTDETACTNAGGTWTNGSSATNFPGLNL